MFLSILAISLFHSYTPVPKVGRTNNRAPSGGRGHDSLDFLNLHSYVVQSARPNYVLSLCMSWLQKIG